MTVISGISALKKRSRTGLLSVASLLPSGVDWRRGIDYVPEGCTAPDATPMCADDINKPAPQVQEAIHFDPFGVVASDGCNDPWASNQEFYDRASRVLDMGQSALLYNMMNDGYVGDVVLHAPTWLLPSFNASGVGDIDPSTRRAYIGPHEVVFDAGYSGLVGPGGDPEGAVALEAGWVYATGPVEYEFGKQIDDDVNIAADNRKNARYVVAERPGIVRFDPCQVFAALVGAPA